MVILRVKKAKSVLEKTRGLLGQKPYPLLIKTRFGIHTFGMKYPIDVLVLDQSNKIVQMKEKLQPNRIFLWNPSYNRLVELPEAFIRTHKVKLHQEIVLVFSD